MTNTDANDARRSDVVTSRDRARAETLERELRATQGAERASRAREAALTCELERAKHETLRAERERDALREALRRSEDACEGLRRRMMDGYRSGGGVLPSSSSSALVSASGGVDGAPTGDGVTLWRERCRAAEDRAQRATEKLAEFAEKSAGERERAVYEAEERAARDTESKWRAEMEELSRTVRLDARALSSSRQRAVDLTADLHEAVKARDEWKTRAEAALESSESMTSTLAHMRHALDEANRRDGGDTSSVVAAAQEESQKLARRLHLAQEQLKAAQSVCDAREVEREKVLLELQKTVERFKSANTELAETRAEREHALETISIERAEKERATGEVQYLRDEIERLRTESRKESITLDARREEIDKIEKDRARELQEAKRDAARHAMTARNLERRVAQLERESNGTSEHAQELMRIQEHYARAQAEVRKLSMERDSLLSQVNELAELVESVRTPSPSLRQALIHRAPLSSMKRLARTDEDEDNFPYADDDAEMDEIFNDVTENALFKETVEEFFEEDDAEDERLEADHAHAYALAQRLRSLEARATSLLSRDPAARR
jgi:DNA repair exonuclease SbcCD ATPase subunit